MEEKVMNRDQVSGLAREQQLKRHNLKVKEAKGIQGMVRSRGAIFALDPIFLKSASGRQVLVSPVGKSDIELQIVQIRP